MVTLPMLGNSNYHSQFYQLLRETLGDSHVSITEIDRITYARDANFQSTIQVRARHFPYHPDIIAWPKGPEEIAKTLKLARRFKVPIVPYGGGSGVCGGTVPTKGGLIIDMKRNDALFDLNKKELWIGVETGIYGQHLETLLNRKGYTLGHFPSSIYCSTVGGWLATRSAGQLSSKYGKIEDMVLALQVVSPNGEIVLTPYVQNAVDSMDWNQFFIGTEGTLGIVSKAWLKIHSLPEHRIFRGFLFPSLSSGMTAVRRILQEGLEPSVLRLYDELDSVLFLHEHGRRSPEWVDSFKKLVQAPFESVLDFLKGWGTRRALSMPALMNPLAGMLGPHCLLILGCEGFANVVQTEIQAAIDIALEEGGDDLGSGIGEAWFAHRYDASYAASPIFYQGAFVDTMEIASTWDKIPQLYSTVRKALEPHALVMAHLSHAYPEGCSIYFTFVAYAATAPKSEALYEQIWKEGLSAAVRVGAAISHHHGIGRLKVDFMNETWNEGIEFLHAFKRKWDPAYLMNPGKLIPWNE